MKYIPSVNIENGIADDFQYIVTPNTQVVLGNIVSSFNEGFHSFTIVGTYGTGKSSFIAALERDLTKGSNVLVKERDILTLNKFEFINIVGDYASLCSLLAKKLGLQEFATTEEVLWALNDKYNALKKSGKFLFIVVDEFGKILEHAAANNPEQELYFLQKLAEFVNFQLRNIILLTTLHQNFGSYSYKLDETQRNEWTKVKGRFKEIVFVEPVEQILQLTADLLGKRVASPSNNAKANIRSLYKLAERYKVISEGLPLETTIGLYPLDPISAICLTYSMQRYGQNERTLFSFLEATDRHSINTFKPSDNHTFSLAEVYDYIIYNFYTYLSEVNADSMDWRSMHTAIERIESGIVPEELVDGSIAIAKTIGILSLFCKNIFINDEFLSQYAQLALGIKEPMMYIDKLKALKIIRYASYKSQYILFEGTDIDIESELYKAATSVARPTLSVENIQEYINSKALLAAKAYYQTGTPRYFQYQISNTPYTEDPIGDVDGYINLVFPNGSSMNDVLAASNHLGKAIIFAYFNNSNDIINHLYEIQKLKYLLKNVVLEDRVAQREVENLLTFRCEQLNKALNENLFDGHSVVWIYNAEKLSILSPSDLNKQLSVICEDVYPDTPILRNELFNRQKVNSAISAARVNLLDAILANSDKEDLGFDAKAFPPEKTIYYTLLRETGLHHRCEDGSFAFGEPTNDNVRALWNACCQFIDSSSEKRRKLGELISILESAPFKLKRGVIDFWLPIFLYIKQQDFALYKGDQFILSITKEVFEILQKHPKEFSIKSYNVSGVKLDFFNKYRKFFQKDDTIHIQGDSLIGVAKPFFQYIRSLDNYAKNTNKFDSPYTAKFRDILLTATDPSKTFLEDLPLAFGYQDLNKDEFLSQFLTLIKQACQELNNCYYNLICRIENSFIEYLGLPLEYDQYKFVLEQRYGNINQALLTAKTKSFLDRILAPSENKTEFIGKIGLVIFDKKVEDLKDSEEPLFIANLLHLFSELDHYTSLTEASVIKGEEAYNIDFVSTSGKQVYKQTFRVPQSVKNMAAERVIEIEKCLTGDNETDVCILLKMLNDRIK